MRTGGFGFGRVTPRASAAMALLLAVGLVAGAHPAGAAPAAPARPSTTNTTAGSITTPLKSTIAEPSQLDPKNAPRIDPNHVFVKFGAPRANFGARIHSDGVQSSSPLATTGWSVVTTTPGASAHVASALSHEPDVIATSPSYIRKTSSIPNDPKYASMQSSYLAPLRVDQAWDLSTGHNITVAVVDTGVDFSHPDLAGKLLNGYNVLQPGLSPADDEGHGTFVSGVIAADTNNGIGVVGVARDAKILPVKVLDSFGEGTDTDIATGITWATDHGANVINLSLGGSMSDAGLEAAVAYAISHNVVVVAAAGNAFTEQVSYPAAYPGVIAVSATAADGSFAYFSSYGWRIDVAAPGMQITSTSANPMSRYETGDGTSFSSPIVASVAAMLLQLHPGWTPAQVRDQVDSTARDAGPPGQDEFYGHGIVDPVHALGGSALAPRPRYSTIAEQPNEVPQHATALTVGAAHTTAFDVLGGAHWYTLNLTPGSYVVHGTAPATNGFEDPHQFGPEIEIYNSDLKFGWSSDDTVGTDYIFPIQTAGTYYLRLANVFPATTRSFDIEVDPALPLTGRYTEELYAGPSPLMTSVAVADVTGDGRPDIIGAMPIPDNELVVVGQGPRRAMDRYAQVLNTDATTGTGIAAGDLDGDNMSDIALATNAGIDVFLQSDGQLSDATLVQPGLVATHLAIADIDGDSHNDIIAAGASGVKVLWGPDFSTTTTVSSTAFSTALAVGDVNNDGHLDVVTCCNASSFDVFTRAAARTFNAAVPYAVAHSPRGIAIGDVTGDNKNDVVVTQHAAVPNAAVDVFTQSGGVLKGPTVHALSAGMPGPVAIADVDGDTHNDIVVMHDASGDFNSFTPGIVGLVRGTGGGAFTTEERHGLESPFIATTFPYDTGGLQVTDLDEDGRADLAMSDFGIAWKNQITGILPALDGAWITDSTPSDASNGVSSTVDPTLVFGRDVDPSTVTGVTVQLLDSTGTAVPATTVYTNGNHTVTITPNSALADGQYSVRADGVLDTHHDPLPGDGLHFTVGAAPDETNPQTSITSGPKAFTTQSSANIVFSSNETSTFLCSIDNGPYSACTSPTSLTSLAIGTHVFRVIARDTAGNEDVTPATISWQRFKVPHGYWMVDSNDKVTAFGTVPHFAQLPEPPGGIDIAATPSGLGYWVVTRGGDVRGYGDAKSFGNFPPLLPGETVTAISPTPTGNGYWLFTSLGRVRHFGDAHDYGEIQKPLNGPVVDAVATPSGHGYYMVGSDGGVFTFGNAHFVGSMGSVRLNAPVRTLVPDPDGTGYWLVASDGGVFSFLAAYHGSMGGKPLNKPIVGMVAFGDGYLMVAADGGVFNFSTKPFYGSLGGQALSAPIVSMAAHA